MVGRYLPFYYLYAKLNTLPKDFPDMVLKPSQSQEIDSYL